MLTKLHKSQRGFTLIELLIALAIAGAIGVAVTMTAQHMITIPSMSNDSNTAINQVRNAVNWINKDVQGADPLTVNDAPDAPGFFIISLQEWDPVTENWSAYKNITYSLEDMAGTELMELWRDYDNGTTRNLIAQFIEPEAAGITECSWNSTLTVTITATIGDETETRTFQVKPRPTN